MTEMPRKNIQEPDRIAIKNNLKRLTTPILNLNESKYISKNIANDVNSHMNRSVTNLMSLNSSSQFINFPSCKQLSYIPQQQRNNNSFNFNHTNSNPQTPTILVNDKCNTF